MSDGKQVTVELGPNDWVLIDKLYGPTIFMDLRIRPDLESGNWIVERYTLLDPLDLSTHRWVEWCQIPGQFDWEFSP